MDQIFFQEIPIMYFQIFLEFYGKCQVGKNLSESKSFCWTIPVTLFFR